MNGKDVLLDSGLDGSLLAMPDGLRGSMSPCNRGFKFSRGQLYFFNNVPCQKNAIKYT